MFLLPNLQEVMVNYITWSDKAVEYEVNEIYADYMLPILRSAAESHYQAYGLPYEEELYTSRLRTGRVGGDRAVVLACEPLLELKWDE
jgi:hypothetical protein